MAKGILFDSTLCAGCRACESACAEKWALPYDDNIAAAERISDKKLTAVSTYGDKYVRRMCRHCEDPACGSVCPVGALEKTSLGPVIYNEDRCMGCRYCMLACPFQALAYEWDRTFPKVRKCNLCHERLKGRNPTACSAACPTGATVTGERNGLIREARRRISANPKQYFDRIYGVREVGGASVLMLAAVPLEQLGLNARLPGEPLPMLTRTALSLVPDVAGIGSVLLGGIYWITHRREEVEAAEGREKKKGVRR